MSYVEQNNESFYDKMSILTVFGQNVCRHDKCSELTLIMLCLGAFGRVFSSAQSEPDFNRVKRNTCALSVVNVQFDTSCGDKKLRRCSLSKCSLNMKRVAKATKNVIVNVFQFIIGSKRLFVKMNLVSKSQKTRVDFESPAG